MTTYCVKAETKHGRFVILGRGFESLKAAEDYRVQLRLTIRVWIEDEAAPELPPPPRRSREENLERAYEAILAAALNNERCPENQTRGVDTHLCGELARAGRIKIEVFARNFRVVTILTGPHAGLKTAPPPYRVTQPKLIITASGKQIIKRFGMTGGEPGVQQPKEASNA